MRAWALLLLLAGCGDPGTGSLALSWKFADGRGCAEAGAATVVVRWGKTSVEPTCLEGLHPAATAVDDLPRGGVELSFEARTPHGGLIYRGAAALDGLPPSLAVILYPEP